MKTFNEIFPRSTKPGKSDMYLLKSWRQPYANGTKAVSRSYDVRMKEMSSIWALAFANFVASHMELVKD